MIRIVCTKSPLTMLPIRALLQHISFRPNTMRHCVAYAFIYPFSSHYRKSLASLSLLERVPEAQFFGVVSQWRVRRWLGWLARAVAPQTAGERIFFYHAEHLDQPSRIFLNLLSCYTPRATVNFVYGPPSRGGAFVADSTNCIASEERLIYPLLFKDPTDVTPAEGAILAEALVGCILSANYWQVDAVARPQLCVDRARALHAQGLAARFREECAAAEALYIHALADKSAPPLVQFEAQYARAMIHLRFYPTQLQNWGIARDCLAGAATVLEKYGFTPESHAYARVMLSGAQALVAFRQKQYEESLQHIKQMEAILDSLPPSERRECCIVTVLGNQAQLYREKGEVERSLEFNAQIVSRDPQLPLGWIEYLRCLLDLKMFDRAGVVFAEALALHHECARLHALHGEYLRQTGQHMHSLSAFERAARYAPGMMAYQEAAQRAEKRIRQRGVAVLL